MSICNEEIQMLDRMFQQANQVITNYDNNIIELKALANDPSKEETAIERYGSLEDVRSQLESTYIDKFDIEHILSLARVNLWKEAQYRWCRLDTVVRDAFPFPFIARMMHGDEEIQMRPWLEGLIQSETQQTESHIASIPSDAPSYEVEMYKSTYLRQLQSKVHSGKIHIIVVDVV
jgi:hypothetical protein